MTLAYRFTPIHGYYITGNFIGERGFSKNQADSRTTPQFGGDMLQFILYNYPRRFEAGGGIR